MSKWLRWYEGTCEDGKFRCVARNAGVTVATVMGVWAALLEDASNDDHRGVAVRGEGFYAAILDLPPEELKRILEEMDEIGVIEAGHGAITIMKWKERQFETDRIDSTGALRQRKYRERKRNVTVTAVTESNGSVTARNGQPRDSVTGKETANTGNVNKIKDHVTPLRNGSVTATKRPDTDTDTDTDTEPEKKETRASALVIGCPPDFREQFWSRYPNKVGKPKAIAKLEQCMRRGVGFADLMAGLDRYIASKPPDRAWLNPETFINQERWADQPAAVTNGRRTVHDAAREFRRNLLETLDEPAPGLREPAGGGSVRLLPPR